MKTILLKTLLLFAFQGHAQLMSSRLSGIEIRAGGILSSFHDQPSDASANKLLVGYDLGIGARFALAQAWSISGGLSLMRKGFRNSTEVYFGDPGQLQLGTLTSITKLTYLVVPVTVDYYPDQSRRVKIGLGFFGARLLKAQDITEMSWRGRDVYGRTDDYQRYDFGLIASLSYSTFKLGQFALSPCLQFHYGLTSISSENTAAGFQGAKNSSLLIGFVITKSK